MSATTASLQPIRAIATGAETSLSLATDLRNNRVVLVRRVAQSSWQRLAAGGGAKAVVAKFAKVKVDGILPCTGIAMIGGDLCLISPNGDGYTLGEVIRQQVNLPLSPLETLRRLAAALDSLHAQGIVHGGIGLDDVFVSTQGEANFAEVESQRLLRGWSQRDREFHWQVPQALTAGTYFAPESVRDGVFYPSSDQFSLAAVALAMIHRAPIDAHGLNEAIAAPNSSEHGAILRNPRAQAAFRRALSDEPQSRYQTCSEFVESLTAAVAPKLGRKLIGIAAVVLALAGGVAGYWWLNGSANQKVAAAKLWPVDIAKKRLSDQIAARYRAHIPSLKGLQAPPELAVAEIKGRDFVDLTLKRIEEGAAEQRRLERESEIIDNKVRTTFEFCLGSPPVSDASDSAPQGESVRRLPLFLDKDGALASVATKNAVAPTQPIPWSIRVKTQSRTTGGQKFQVELLGRENLQLAKQVFQLQDGKSEQEFTGALKANAESLKVGDAVKLRVQLIHDEELTDWYESNTFAVGQIVCGRSSFAFDAAALLKDKNGKEVARARDRRLDTGITLNDLSRIRIHANGKIAPFTPDYYKLVGGVANRFIGPEGVDGETPEARLLPDAGVGALLYTVGQVAGWKRPTLDHLIDPSRDFENASGTLAFTINTYVWNPKVRRDLDSALFWQRGGEFQVTVDHYALLLPPGMSDEAKRNTWTHAEDLLETFQASIPVDTTPSEGGRDQDNATPLRGGPTRGRDDK